MRATLPIFSVFHKSYENAFMIEYFSCHLTTLQNKQIPPYARNKLNSRVLNLNLIGSIKTAEGEGRRANFA